MLNFVGGLCFAAILMASIKRTDLLSSWSPMVLIIGIFLSSWRKSAYFLLGAIWYGVCYQSELVRSCDEFYWFLCQCSPEAEPTYRFMLGSWLGFFLRPAKSWLAASATAWDPVWGPWALGLIGGELDKSHEELVQLYRQLGLLHVLVISGSHFSFLSRLGILTVGLPSRVLYICRVLDFRPWFSFHLLYLSLVWLLLGFYGLMVGFPPPCQRAFLMGLISTWWPLIKGRSRPRSIWVFTAFFQALLFPLNFVSLSNALSWSALAIIHRFSARKVSFSGLFHREIAIACMSLAYFGGFSPLGLILNPLLEPIWNGVLVLAILGIGGGGEAINEILTLLHRTLATLGDIQHSFWTSSSLGWSSGLENGARVCMWALTLSWLLGAPDREAT